MDDEQVAGYQDGSVKQTGRSDRDSVVIGTAASHSSNENCHIEILPPAQNRNELDRGLQRFEMKYRKLLEGGHRICITDNAMGKLAFQGMELIEVLDLPVVSDQIVIHLNTFHTKRNLDEILSSCADRGVVDLLIISGDGNERLPRLTPNDIGYPQSTVVTSVELIGYVVREYPGVFNVGVAFNPYEPENHEFEKMQRKVDAGARYAITQPLLGKNPLVDKLIEQFQMPVVVEVWMSKKLHLISECVGYGIPETTAYDPIATLRDLQSHYPNCGLYLALLGYKTQYPILTEILAK